MKGAKTGLGCAELDKDRFSTWVPKLANTCHIHVQKCHLLDTWARITKCGALIAITSLLSSWRWLTTGLLVDRRPSRPFSFIGHLNDRTNVQKSDASTVLRSQHCLLIVVVMPNCSTGISPSPASHILCDDICLLYMQAQYKVFHFA